MASSIEDDPTERSSTQRIAAYAHGVGGGWKPVTWSMGTIGSISRDGVSGPKCSVFTPGSVFCT